jgi:acyl carrier protein
MSSSLDKNHDLSVGWMTVALRAEIKRFILQNYLFSTDETALSDTDSLMQKGIVDSTGVLELVMYLEEQHGIKIQDEDLVPANLDSVANIVAFVERKQATGAELGARRTA